MNSFLLKLDYYNQLNDRLKDTQNEISGLKKREINLISEMRDISKLCSHKNENDESMVYHSTYDSGAQINIYECKLCKQSGKKSELVTYES